MSLEYFPLTTNPDWGLANNPKADVIMTDLGDGYQVRRPKGINYLKETWSPNWSFLSREEAQNIYEWLKQRLNLTSFLWRPPDDPQTYRVVCTSVSKAISDVGISAVSATFEQDHNP